MTFDHSPSDRVQVRQLGELMHPGACALCGNGNNENGYVDLGVYYEYEGQVYICIDPCMHQVINMIGCLLPSESEHLRDLNSTLADRVKELEEANAVVVSRLSAFNSLLSGAINDGTITLPVIEDEGPEPEDAFEFAGITDSGESEVTESTSEQGPDDVKQSKLRHELDF